MPTANSGSVGRGKPFDVHNQAVRATRTHSSQRSHLPIETSRGNSNSLAKAAGGNCVSQTITVLSGVRI